MFDDRQDRKLEVLFHVSFILKQKQEIHVSFILKAKTGNSCFEGKLMPIGTLGWVHRLVGVSTSAAEMIFTTASPSQLQELLHLHRRASDLLEYK